MAVDIRLECWFNGEFPEGAGRLYMGVGYEGNIKGD